MKGLFRMDIKIDFSCLKAKNLPEKPSRVHEPLASEQREKFTKRFCTFMKSIYSLFYVEPKYRYDNEVYEPVSIYGTE